jgi:hypothetical protein
MQWGCNLSSPQTPTARAGAEGGKTKQTMRKDFTTAPCTCDVRGHCDTCIRWELTIRSTEAYERLLKEPRRYEPHLETDVLRVVEDEAMFVSVVANNMARGFAPSESTRERLLAATRRLGAAVEMARG